MRMAETRAANRDLRKAYGIGLSLLEELPPYILSHKQVPSLRRTLQFQSPLQKGVLHAYPHPGSQLTKRTKTSGRARRARR